MLSIRRLTLCVVASLAASATAWPALALGAWPAKPVTVIVSYPPGGDTMR